MWWGMEMPFLHCMHVGQIYRLPAGSSARKKRALKDKDGGRVRDILNPSRKISIVWNRSKWLPPFGGVKMQFSFQTFRPLSPNGYSFFPHSAFYCFFFLFAFVWSALSPHAKAYLCHFPLFASQLKQSGCSRQRERESDRVFHVACSLEGARALQSSMDIPPPANGIYRPLLDLIACNGIHIYSN